MTAQASQCPPVCVKIGISRRVPAGVTGVIRPGHVRPSMSRPHLQTFKCLLFAESRRKPWQGLVVFESCFNIIPQTCGPSSPPIHEPETGSNNQAEAKHWVPAGQPEHASLQWEAG